MKIYDYDELNKELQTKVINDYLQRLIDEASVKGIETYGHNSAIYRAYKKVKK